MLSKPGAVVRLAIIGLVVLCTIGSFAYVAGWLTPGELTPRRFVDGFEEVNGIHPGFRRNHAKGVCSGDFESNGQAARVSPLAEVSLTRRMHQRRCGDWVCGSSLAADRSGESR